MNPSISTAPVPRKAILIALIHKDQLTSQAKEFLEELAFLSRTLGFEIKGKFFQKLSRPNARYFMGKGKLEEIKTYVKNEAIDVVIFDDDLGPSQLRNIEKALKLTIYDRSLLILDIFRQRAQTSQAKTQVELARYEYLLPRLTRRWTHLERQRGGTGTRGGAGEKEIETDRRAIRDQISVLKKRLKKIEQQGITRRKSREGIVRVSLVGYTNAGKSTLMNLLAKTDVLAENKLFATVDATVRRMVIKNVPFLLSDTVGFIRKLPHALIASFKSTLDEVREADILLHVVDFSHPSFEEQMTVVDNTLDEMGAGNKSVITVFNKIDKIPDNRGIAGPQRKHFSFDTGRGVGQIFISAVNKENMKGLQEILYKAVLQHHLAIYPNYLKDAKH